MPVGVFLGALRRRWLLLLVGCLATAGLSVGAYLWSKPTYEITGTVLLLPPASSVSSTSNPFVQLDGLRQTVELLGVALTDQATQEQMRSISPDVDFTVQADGRTSSPLLVIDVKDSRPDTALKIRDLLVAQAPDRLEAMQVSLRVQPGNQVTTTVVTMDAQAQEVGRGRLRAAVVAGALGLALTLAATALWDAHRRRATKGKPADATDGVPPS